MVKIAMTFITLLISIAFGQTPIYRSIQAGKTSALTIGSGNDLTISGSTATFANALPDTVGVGDVIQYDDDNDGDIDANDSICFIHGRTSSTSYTVKSTTGGTPTATAAADQDWSIFRSYIGLGLAEAGTENTGIDSDLRAFDPGNRDISPSGNNETWYFACYRGQESVTVSTDFDAWVTGGNFMIVYSPYLITEVGVSQRHSGSLTTTGCYLLTRTNVGPVLRINTGGVSSNPGHVWIDGIQLRSTTGSAASSNSIVTVDVAMATGDEIRVSNCVIKGVTIATSAQWGVVSNVDVKTMKVWNNIVYDVQSSSTGNTGGIGFESGGAGTMYCYNNTVHNSTNSYRREAGTIVVKNCISQSDATDGFSGTFDAASDYNISDRASDAPGANSKSGTSVTFQGEASDIFLLDITDTGAKGAGTNLSSDANLPFSTDILNTTRPTIWDMGAHQITAGAARRKLYFK